MKRTLSICALLCLCTSSAYALETADYTKMLTPAQGGMSGKTRGIAMEPAPQAAPAVAETQAPRYQNQKSQSGPEVAMQLQFATGSAELSSQARYELRKIAAALSSRKLRNYCFKVEGHTDNVGSADRNLRLSERRAQAVVRYLLENSSLQAAQLEAEGYGESLPAVPNVDASSRRINRRVVIRNTMTEITQSEGEQYLVDQLAPETPVPAAPIATSTPVPTPSVTAMSRNLKIFRESASGRGQVELTDGEVIRSGENFSIHFNPGGHQYAYVCQQDGSGQVTVLFPGEYSRQANPVAPEADYNLPNTANGDKWFTLDQTVGKEQLLMLTSDTPLSDPGKSCTMTLAQNTTGSVTRGIAGLSSGKRSELQESLFCDNEPGPVTRGIAGLSSGKTAPAPESRKCRGTMVKRYFLHE